MRFELSVTSISWIPSAAITGVTRLPFDPGVTYYDDPSPDPWQDPGFGCRAGKRPKGLPAGDLRSRAHARQVPSVVSGGGRHG